MDRNLNPYNPKPPNRMSYEAERVPCFSLQHWPINQYVIHLIVSDSHNKGKDTVAVFLFVNFPYNHFDNPVVVHALIWSDAPSSEFINKSILKFC